MKDLGETKLRLDLQIERCADAILVHQKYSDNVLNRSNLDKCHHPSTPMVTRSLNMAGHPFRPKDEHEEFLGT